MPLIKVTKISTVCKVSNKKLTSKKCFSEIHKLLQINCGIAFVLVSAIKIFNVMRRIKTFFRIPMEIKLLDSSNLQLVADDFAKASETLINYFRYINRAAFNNTGQQKKIFLLVPQILELFWSIFGALIPKVTAVFSHQL